MFVQKQNRDFFHQRQPLKVNHPGFQAMRRLFIFIEGKLLVGREQKRSGLGGAHLSVGHTQEPRNSVGDVGAAVGAFDATLKHANDFARGAGRTQAGATEVVGDVERCVFQLPSVRLRA